MPFWSRFSNRSEDKSAKQPISQEQLDFNKHKDRVVRVFVSSTFRDMQEDRDVLVKFVFPELKKRCRRRGVEFIEIDLRWGVTEEQAERGDVLPICLAEIANCRPYFIGLLGERYGWLPKQIDSQLLETQSWLKEHQQKSLTELEILHGVLNNPKMADHSFFYFRDKAYLNQIASSRRKDFISESKETKAKLTNLKERIRKTTHPVRENYPNPKALRKLVLEDIWGAINQEYPKGTEPDPLERQAKDHQAFLEARAKVYIGREEYFKRLYEHVQSEKSPLIILGESGMGKSALISNWIKKYRQNHPKDFLLFHFTGSTPKSADYTAILLRILKEIKKRYSLRDEIPSTPEKLRAAFPNWLSMAAARGRFILILDGLNQLEDIDNALDLYWLPEYIPENIRLIVSTLPGRSLAALEKRGWNNTLEVKPLKEDERKTLISENLKVYRRELDEKYLLRITKAKQTKNPLYLKVLLDELRVFGIFEELPRRINHYLEAQTVDDLYEKVLERLEEDYQKERPNLVRDAMSRIFAARRGLSESELMELLGAKNKPLPRLMWSPLFLALEDSLVARSGLLNFFHDYLRKAVEDRYLKAEKEQKDAHLRLAEYFDKKEIDARKIDELPFQLQEANEWGKLFALLKDLDFFSAAWEQDEFEVKAYWATVEKRSSYRMVDGYRSMTDAPARYSQYVWHLATLLQATGHPEEALSLQTFLSDSYRQSGDPANLQASLGNQANIFYTRGKLDEAMKLHKEEERICRELGNKDSLQASLGNQAVILYAWGRLDEAIALLKEKEKICRELGNKNGLSASLGNQAAVLKSWGKLDEAMALYKKQEKICRELGNKDGLSASLGNQANILYAWGKLDEAMALYKKQEKICRELGNKDSLQISLGNQANILYAWGKLDEAMALHKEEEKICRELGNKNGLARSLGNQALILAVWGKLDEAMALLKEKEKICRELGNKDGLANSLISQALILAQKPEPHQRRQALALAKEAYQLALDYGLKALAKQIKPHLDKIKSIN